MTISRLKALPTTYRRVKFRSRLEARWAVFFDALDLHWEYEPQGFTLDNRKDKHPDSCYCPDFLVRTPQNEDMWIEIKPYNVKQNDKFDKFRGLIGWDTRSLLLSGTPCDVLDKYYPKYIKIDSERLLEKSYHQQAHYRDINFFTHKLIRSFNPLSR